MKNGPRTGMNSLLKPRRLIGVPLCEARSACESIFHPPLGASEGDNCRAQQSVNVALPPTLRSINRTKRREFTCSPLSHDTCIGLRNVVSRILAALSYAVITEVCFLNCKRWARGQGLDPHLQFSRSLYFGQIKRPMSGGLKSYII